MYPNLELEMFKRKVTVRDMAKRIGISESAMRNKIKGRNEFLLSEVEKILDIFPEVSWRVLFASEEEETGQTAVS